MTASGTNKKTLKPWSRKPSVFDAKRTPIDGKLVWGGTLGRVCFTVNPYFIPGTGACGLGLRLEAVQVLELVSGGQRTGAAYGFSEEDGYTAESATDTSVDDDSEGASDATDF